MPARADEAVLLDHVAAVVGDVPILRSDVLAAVRSWMPKASKDPSELARAQKQALERLIDNALIVRDALHRKIEVSDLEVAQAKERVAQNAGRTHEAVLEDVTKQGFTAREYDAVLRAEILKQKWMVFVVKPRVRAPATPEAMLDPDGPYVRELMAERARAVAELRKQIYVRVR